MEINLTVVNIPATDSSTASTKPPLVCLSAFPYRGSFYSAMAKALNYPCLLIDPPGFTTEGTSSISVTLGDSTPSIEAYAEAVVAGLNELNIQKFALIGCSMGGYTALRIMEIAPHRVSAIALFDTNARSDSDEAKSNRLRIAQTAEKGSLPDDFIPGNLTLLSKDTALTQPQLMADINTYLPQVSPLSVAWCQRAMATRADRLEVLQKHYGKPSLIARGIDDDRSSFSQCQEMADALGTGVTEVPSAGHLLPLEQPQITASLVSELLKQS